MTVGLRSRSPSRATSRRIPEQTAATSAAISSAVLFGAPSSFAWALAAGAKAASRSSRLSSSAGGGNCVVAPAITSLTCLTVLLITGAISSQSARV